MLIAAIVLCQGLFGAAHHRMEMSDAGSDPRHQADAPPAPDCAGAFLILSGAALGLLLVRRFPALPGRRIPWRPVPVLSLCLPPPKPIDKVVLLRVLRL